MTKLLLALALVLMLGCVYTPKVEHSVRESLWNDYEWTAKSKRTGRCYEASWRSNSWMNSSKAVLSEVPCPPELSK
jgi:hypothetical protein